LSSTRPGRGSAEPVRSRLQGASGNALSGAGNPDTVLGVRVAARELDAKQEWAGGSASHPGA